MILDVVKNSSTTITQDWVTNLNNVTKTFFFVLLVIVMKLTFSIR
jgi:hypothetical protein